MKKILAIGAAVLVLFVVVAGALMWYWMSKPLYEPGMVRASRNLQTPLALAAQSEPQFWTLDENVRLYHFAEGAGRNVVVVHGGPGYPFSEPLPGLQPLTDKYRFLYYDQRGSGRSTRPIDRFSSSNYYENMQTLDRTLGLGAQIADLERIRQILGEDKILLLGHSFGGFLASLYAAEFPERVEALVLVAPAEVLVMPPESGGLFEQVKPWLPEEMRTEYEAFLKRYLDFSSVFSKSDAELAALNTEFAKYYAVAASAKGYGVPKESQPVSMGNPPVGSGGWMVQAMYLSMGLSHDYRSTLKPVRAPALVLHGEKDLQPEKASRIYAEAFPNAEFRVIKDAGHFPFSEQPEEFFRLVGEFLARTGIAR